MKIIITNTFEKDFYSIFNSYKLMNFFIGKIYKSKLINLSTEYKKFKIDILNQSVRWIIYIEDNQEIYIPIFIVKKADKKYWMNLILTKEILEILDLKFKKSINDFNLHNFKVY